MSTRSIGSPTVTSSSSAAAWYGPVSYTHLDVYKRQKLLYTLVFGLGAALAGFAGLMQAPILTVQIGMGENILILAFVVIIIGGVGDVYKRQIMYSARLGC